MITCLYLSSPCQRVLILILKMLNSRTISHKIGYGARVDEVSTTFTRAISHPFYSSNFKLEDKFKLKDSPEKYCSLLYIAVSSTDIYSLTCDAIDCMSVRQIHMHVSALGRRALPGM